ncbi:MAG: hypothetical protein PHO26_05055 [Dehalococcoidia bacterium]|nr:hypothetical protein [Dehalococcoidia bacterium]MDD5494453.1 hypothetical protein [Dehalococcoidia bacterium]
MTLLDLSFFTRGDIPGGFKKEATEVLTDCYKRFGHSIPYKIEVYFFDTDADLHNFIREEKFKLGLTFAPIDEASACTFDVLRGYPRLLVCAERLAKYSKHGREGALRHEAAHTVLHGSLEYNIFQIPEDCRHTAMIKGIEDNILGDIFFQLTMGVKDFEAINFLIKHDFINCQVIYGLEWIQPSEEDRASWYVAKTNRQTRFVYESSLMRPLLFTDPLLALPKSRKVNAQDQVMLGARIEQMLDILGETEENKVLKVAASIIGSITGDTHSNIDSAFRQLMNLI